MERKTTLQKYYKIWDDEEGVVLTVGPDSNTGRWVEIFTDDKLSREYYGQLNLVLPPDVARVLGHVLLMAAKDAEPEK